MGKNFKNIFWLHPFFRPLSCDQNHISSSQRPVGPIIWWHVEIPYCTVTNLPWQLVILSVKLSPHVLCVWVPHFTISHRVTIKHFFRFLLLLLWGISLLHTVLSAKVRVFNRPFFPPRDPKTVRFLWMDLLLQVLICMSFLFDQSYCFVLKVIFVKKEKIKCCYLVAERGDNFFFFGNFRTMRLNPWWLLVCPKKKTNKLVL